MKKRKIKKIIIQIVNKICKCGCGNKIIWKPFHNRYNVKYVYGHQFMGKKHSEETKRKISMTLKGRKGHPSYLKDLTYEEYFGVNKAKKIKRKVSISNKGRLTWNKGLTKDTDERVKKYHEKSVETRMKNVIYNPMWENKEFKEKILEKMALSQKIKPNRPEKILIKLNYKFINKQKSKYYNYTLNN